MLLLKRKTVLRVTVYILLIVMTLLLSGCPQKRPYEAYENGKMFIRFVESALYYRYEVITYREDSPTVYINYELPDGTAKTAIFTLDGYDPEKKIGFRCVTEEDKQQWEQARLEGDLEAPDLGDISLIQQEAVRYEFPIIFICIYEYQSFTDDDQITENELSFKSDLDAILSAPEIDRWAEDGGYHEASDTTPNYEWFHE